MRGDALVNRQHLMAQAIFALADHITQSNGYALTPIVFAKLPTPPATGMIACVNDSTVSAWGSVIVGGGTNTVFAFYNGTNWVVK